MSTYKSSYYQKNKEKRLAYAAEYRAKRRQELAQMSREHYEANREEAKQHMRDYRQKAKMEAMEALGCRCVRCGFTDTRALQIDHVYGGGNREEALRKRGTKFYRQVRDEALAGSPKYQLLCANCNWIKRHENGEHK